MGGEREIIQMKVLVPVDGSECSFRALDFATEFVSVSGAELDVIHITDYRGETASTILREVEERLADAGIEGEPEIVTDARLSDARYSNQIGKDILEIADDENHDHIIMGHHGTGRIGRVILGSAAETVVRASELPVTIIP